MTGYRTKKKFRQKCLEKCATLRRDVAHLWLNSSIKNVVLARKECFVLYPVNAIKMLLYASLALLVINCSTFPIKPRSVSISGKQSMPEKAASEMSSLFKKGDDGYACYRIPAVIIAPDGSVLAFCEARKNGCSDTGDIDLVMKKSVNNGKTWGEMQVVWDDGENVCGNPVPVLDEATGKIHLLLTWNDGRDKESEIIAGTSIDTRRIFHLISDDNGQSWSGPVEITKEVKLPNWTWYATGPVHGIQLKQKNFQGRMIIPCDHIEAGTRKYYSHIFYSDDHGKTWSLGGTTPQDQVNECTVAELSNGDLLLNMRNYYRTASQTRQVAISRDGGISWQEQKFDKQLPEPRCQGALLSLERKGKQILLFSNPAHQEKRENMTLSISEDQGKSWTAKSSIYPSHSAYSDMGEMRNGNIILLHEGGTSSPYDAIYYSIISLVK